MRDRVRQGVMMKETAIDVRDVKITYKLMKNFSIQKNLLHRDAEKA